MPDTLAPPADADLLKSGTSTRRAAAARSGFLPVPLDQVQIRALEGIGIYLHTGRNDEKRFTLYRGPSERFTEFHRRRLAEAAVRFIYVPMSCHTQFRQQVEKELESFAANPEVARNTKAALVYETSLELVDEVLAEGNIAKNMPRLENVARATCAMVMKDKQAFGPLFETAQHDFYTATHMVNVGTWMTSLCYAMGITDPKTLQDACSAGMVHDVGKSSVPEEILNLPGQLTDQQWKILRDHPVRGAEHLKRENVTNEIILRVTLEHHERMDGKGYPYGLNYKQMHRLSLISAVVDSFDAMTSCRPFKNRVKTVGEALDILKSEAPSKYDPEVVAAWTSLLSTCTDIQVAGPGDVEDTASRIGRRLHERFTINCPLKVSELTPASGTYIEGRAQEGKAHNISQGGVGLLTREKIPLHRYVRIALKGKGSLQNKVLEGCVMRCREYKDGWHDIGIRLCQPGAQEAASQKVLAEDSALAPA